MATDRLIIPQPQRVIALEYGPWLGSMRSISSELVPKEYVASPSQTPSLDFLYLPKYGSWKRRLGQTVQFDTLSGGASVTGLLPDNWADEGTGKGARVRHIEEFISDSVTDDIPTISALLTTETIASGLDDGYFANFWWRDQTNDLNNTLGSEYSSVTYPALGSLQYYRFIPLWYDSGDGGITRGVTEYLRRFFLSGSRRFTKVGKWWYFPSYHGTPSRWNGVAGSAGIETYTITGDDDITEAVDESADDGGTDATYTNLTAAGDGDWIRLQNNVGGRTISYDLSAAIDDNVTYTIHYTAKNDLGTPHATTYVQFAIITSAQKRYASAQVFPAASWTTDFADYTIDITCDGTAGVNGALTANTIEIGEAASTGTGTYSSFDYIYITAGVTDAMAGYLFPSGPFPPTHCGTVAGTAAVTAEYTYPNADSVDGSWVNSAGNNTDMYTYIDDAVGSTDDTNYINSNASNSACTIDFATPSTVPNTSDTVTIRYRNRNIVVSGHNNVVMEFIMNSTVIATVAGSYSATTAWETYGRVLTEAEISAANTADATWATAKIRFTTSSESSGGFGDDEWHISQAYIERLPAAAGSEGGWKGKDRFLKGMYYRFEDGSIWALTTPRFPNDILTSGLDIVTVDSANPDVAYRKLTWSNIPVPPKGVIKVGLCRSTKIDSTVDDDLLLNPYDMRLVREVDAGTTTYDDYAGDDDALGLDVTGAFIRFNHRMPPAARYNAAGDMRMVHAYGKENPCAIVIAPVGRTADYDLNLADTSSTLYTSNGSYMQVAIASNGTGTLTLIQSDASAATDTETITLAAAGAGGVDTMQKLVDTINATSCAVDGQQWRAQLCPFASPDANPLTALTPHSRTFANVTISGQTITLAGGGLSKVPVGAYILRVATVTSAYVTRIDSDTQLTFSGTVSAGTVNVTFYTGLGDTATSTAVGYQRVISNSLPGFLYFNKTYLDTLGVDKSGAWMTVATPGSVKSAPNCFSTSESNRFLPPLEAGIAMGAVPVDQGFVIPYANKIGSIRPRGPDSIRDEDYSLIIINEDHGCCAWNTVSAGNRFAVFLSPDGFYASDLERSLRLSGAIWTAPISSMTTDTGVGDFMYEVPASVAATAQDNDASYAYARVISNVIRVGYRTSSSTTHCNRMVHYDFSAASDSNGLKALTRENGVRWGWSLPLSQTVALVGYGRRNDGLHIYGWNDANAGATGDGRIDEIETGQTDNGTAISTGTVSIPWIQADEGEMISVQRLILEHNSPSGSTGSLVWHRSYSNDAYTLTPGTSSLDLLSELKHLTTPARAITAAGYFEYKQASGTARELRKIKVFLIPKRRLR
jgi:hypothetical protein